METTQQTQQTQQTAHALLSASGAHRWMLCTPSARVEAGYPDKGSDYAREGSLAHAMAARMLKQEIYGFVYTPYEDAEIEELKRYYTEEMDLHVGAYVNYVLERVEAAAVYPDYRVFIEARVDYSRYVPDGFGTSDVVIVTPDYIEVIDLKYGKGVKVSAVENPQLKLYALGAWTTFCSRTHFDPEELRFSIFQPRIGHRSSWQDSLDSVLRWWRHCVKDAADAAYRGEGERKAGEHCRFCKAKEDCGTRRAFEAMADFEGVEIELD